MCLVLIVEDEQRVVAFVDKGLRRNGFKTRVAVDGEEALQALRSQTFDLIILDLGLPKVSGWVVLKELQRLSNQGPVIVVTAETDVRAAVLQAGASNYLAKPFRFQDLLATIQTVLSS